MRLLLGTFGPGNGVVDAVDWQGRCWKAMLLKPARMLLERERELDLLAGVLAEVGSSGGKVVLVRGEAGIGKTALVREFLEDHAEMVHVHIGWCDDLRTARPLSPFWDMARSEPSLSVGLLDGDRIAVLEAVMDLLSRGLRSTALVIEDTQWADEATLDAIKYLGRRIDQTSALLILTYRDAEVDYDHPLRAVIGEIPPDNLLRVHLERLTVDAVAAMIEGADFGLDELMVLTDGNPLFVTEMLATRGEHVPRSVQDSVIARAAKLSTRAREAVDLVSVIPGATERAIAESITGVTDEDLAEGVRQGLIGVGETLVYFHHEMARRAVQSALSPGRRRQLNAQVLTELVKVTELADPARLVHHARDAGDTDAIMEYAPKAARAARDVEAHREAVAQFRTLEPYLDQIPLADRAAILEDWAHSEHVLEDFPGSLDKLTRAIDLYRAAGDDIAVGRALTFEARLHETSLRPGEADRCLSEAMTILEKLPASPALAFAVSQQAWLAMMRGDDRRAGEHAERAMLLAEESGDELTLINALNTKGLVQYRQGDQGGMTMLEEAWKMAVEGSHAYEEIRALHNMSAVAFRQRALGLAHDAAQRTLDAASKYKLPELNYTGQADLSEVLVRTGEWEAAEDLATELLAILPPEEEWLRGSMTWVLGLLETRTGRPQAKTTLKQHWSAQAVTRQLQNMARFASAPAEYMWVTGDIDTDQVAEFRQLLDDVIQLGNTWDTGELALWLWRLGELTEAPEGIAEPFRLVMTGQPLAAAEIWNELGLPYQRAIALSHGDSNARLQALEILDGLGATAVADKLRQELRDQGVAVPRRKTPITVRGVGLTARQTEVLSLLTEQLSNVEIADRLFLSPRTVEHHVAAVMSKLNASSREEAVAKAWEQDLLTT